jgi:carbon monoxide dehydrogenase subunit G
MDMTGEFRIPAPREAVWKALNDPEILKQCIAGCEELQKTSDTEFVAKVTARVGPVKASFNGKVTLSDLDPPNGYKISGEGQGGAAGFARGGAEVHLEPDGDGTLLKYSVNAAIGGKLAQIGARLIDGTARKMANDFFAKFAEIVGAAQPAGGAPAPPSAAPQSSAQLSPGGDQPAQFAATPAATAISSDPSAGLKPWVWVGALVVLALILLFYYGRR